MEFTIRSQGKQYRLSKKSNEAAQHTAQKAFTRSQVDTILQNAKLSPGDSWSKLWQQLKPLGGQAHTKDKDILSAIADAFANSKIDITVVDNNPGSTSGNNGGAKGGSGGGSSSGGSDSGSSSNNNSSSSPSPSEQTRGDASQDKMQVEGGETAHSEKNATSNADPSKGGDQDVDDSETAGEPISMVTGEELLQLNDFTLPGPMPLSWTRTYRSSLSDKDQGLGHGWFHSASDYLVLNDFTLSYHTSEGREIPFNLPRVNQRSKYIPEQYNLDRISDNVFILKKHGEWDKVFTRVGGESSTCLLTQLRHPSYRPAQNILGIKHEERGFAIRLHHNEQLRLSKIEGNWGKSLLIARDARGRVSSLTLLDQASKAKRVIATYRYSAEGDLIAQRNAKNLGEDYEYNHHLLARRQLKSGFSFYFEWDAKDSSARCLHNWGDQGIYDYRFEWDPDNNRSRTTDSRGFTSEFVYNEYGQILEEKDNEGHVHTYEYDKGRKDAYIDPEGHRTDYFYDAENNPAGVRDALGHSTTLGYFDGRPTSFSDKDKTHWRREYNRQGQITALIDPYQQATRYTYNTQGLVSSVTDPMGRKTLYNWSTKGDLLSITDPLGHKRKFTYDTWGQATGIEFFIKGKESTGQSQLEYDEVGLIQKVTAPNGDVTSYTYNDNDQLIRYSDPQGCTTEFKYDGLSQVVERIDPEGNSLKYEYDKERNLTTIVNENGERYQFFYDGNERLIKEIGFDGRVQNYQYNKAGHLVKHMDAGVVLTEFERDAIGQMLTKISRAKRSGQLVEEKTRYQYDAKGRLVESYNDHQYLAFEYNRFGKLVKEHHSDLNEKKERIPATMVDIGLNYIWPGIRSGITLPDGEHIDYRFDAQNLLTGINFKGKRLAHIQRDEFGREISRSQGALNTESHYDPMGRLQQQISYNKAQKTQGPIQREYGYDQFGNLNFLADGPSETKFAYDLLNRLTKTESSDGNSEHFAFDPASNLVGIDNAPIRSNKNEATKGNRLTLQGDRKFTYDQRGNLVKENRGKDGKLETLFQYNLQNQLVKVVKDGQTTEYKYDPLGRRIEKSDAFGSTLYLWVGDQLTQETRNNIKKTYIYEPESYRPVAMEQDGNIYHYHLDHIGTPRELTDTDGKVVWKAKYKTYGNVALKEVEEVENNLRFQGQYFDEETGLHYNRHRYYNPNTGQFTTQDPIGLLGGSNVYQYSPNPVSWVDPLGLTAAKESTDRQLGEIANVVSNKAPIQYLENDSFTAAGQPIHHGPRSTAIGDDPATLNNFRRDVDMNGAHNVIVHGSRPDYDNQGGIFLLDQKISVKQKGVLGRKQKTISNPTNAHQVAEAIWSNPNYSPGDPIVLVSCWGASNGMAKELSEIMNAEVRGYSRPVGFNSETGKWDQMDDDIMYERHPDLIDIKPEEKVFKPSKSEKK